MSSPPCDRLGTSWREERLASVSERVRARSVRLWSAAQFFACALGVPNVCVSLVVAVLCAPVEKSILARTHVTPDLQAAVCVSSVSCRSCYRAKKKAKRRRSKQHKQASIAYVTIRVRKAFAPQCLILRVKSCLFYGSDAIQQSERYDGGRTSGKKEECIQNAGAAPNMVSFLLMIHKGKVAGFDLHSDMPHQPSLSIEKTPSNIILEMSGRAIIKVKVKEVGKTRE
ncbi:hypothetical protein Tco_1274368 [Tanacetum coccineum]